MRHCPTHPKISALFQHSHIVGSNPHTLQCSTWHHGGADCSTLEPDQSVCEDWMGRRSLKATQYHILSYKPASSVFRHWPTHERHWVMRQQLPQYIQQANL